MTEHILAKTYGWTHENIMNMTPHEIAYYITAISMEAREAEKERKKIMRRMRRDAV
ncbi:MAG: hypothetical protein QW544_02230 [Candidatus Caldarchaeum sp.]